MSLAADKTPTRHPVIPPSAVAPPVGSRAASPTTGPIPPRMFPYGLNTVAQQYASSISTSMHIYGEFLGHHPCFVLDLRASTPASEYWDSAVSPGTEHHVITSSRYDAINRRPHMHPSYYYFGALDSDSADDSYDPTRECFHIDGAIASDSEAEAAVGGRNATPPHVEPPAHGTRPNF
jgi:hypothetical protein